MTLAPSDLAGIFPPLVTTFTEDGDLDLDAYRAEVTHVAQFPVGGVVVGAATGEGSALEPDETASLVRVAKDVVGDRFPVIAGVLETSTRKAVAKSKAAADAGADALMVTPVTYLPDSHDAAMNHFSTVAASMSAPLMIYNALAHNRLTPDTLIELTTMDEVVAVKLGYGATSLHDLRVLLEAAGDRASIMWSQDQFLLPGYCLGATGSVSTVDSIMPGLTCQLFEAVQTGNMDLARKIDRTVSAMAGILGPDDLPSATKTAITLQGRDVGLPRAPYAPVGGARLDRIRELVSQAGLLAS